MPNKIVFMGALVNYSQPASFTGSVVKEYLLIIQPAAAVQQQVKEATAGFVNHYGVNSAAGMPYITVAAFLAKEEMEETLLRWMHRIISSFKSFTVALNNYSGMPNTATVYLRIQDHQPFKQLARELKVIDELVRSNGLPKAQLVTYPQLAIAHSLETALYEKAMMEYSQKDFYAAFQVQELHLIKRLGQFDAGTQVSVLRLQP